MIFLFVSLVHWVLVASLFFLSFSTCHFRFGWLREGESETVDNEK